MNRLIRDIWKTITTINMIKLASKEAINQVVKRVEITEPPQRKSLKGLKIK
jgi:hypothetical protein